MINLRSFVFKNIGIYMYKFPLSTTIVLSHKFWYVVISFSLISKCFLISLVIFSLNHLLFRSILFSLHIFMNFPNFFLVLTFQFHCTVVGEHIFDYFNTHIFSGLILLS